MACSVCGKAKLAGMSTRQAVPVKTAGRATPTAPRWSVPTTAKKGSTPSVPASQRRGG